MKNTTNNKDSFVQKAGDAVERLGEKVSNAGAKKVGDAISRAGDKLEHSQDDKKPKDKNTGVY